MKAFWALLICILMTVNVYADEVGMSHRPDLVTDYYMIVESPDGGLDFYSNASAESSKLNNELIPNGTALHIEGEKTDENNRIWGYTQYHGMYGYILEDDLRPATKSECIDSELYLAGKDNVDYNADYDIEPRQDAGSVYLYQGPGEKYGKVPGTDAIPGGSKLHVTLDADMKDGSHWVQAETQNGTKGWVNMRGMKPYGTADTDNNLVNMEVSNNTQSQQTDDGQGTVPEAAGETQNGTPEVSGEAQNQSNSEEQTGTEPAEDPKEADLLAKGATATVTPSPEPTKAPTSTPKPTKAPTATPMPTSTPTPTPEPTKAPTATPQPTATAVPTPEPTKIPTETPAPTAEPTKEAVPTAEPAKEAVKEAEAETAPKETDSKEASADQVTGVSSIVKNPFVWIIIVVIIAVVILLIYHFKKRDNNE